MNRRLNWMVWVAVVLCVPAVALARKHGGGGKGEGKKEHKHAVWLVDSVNSNSVTLAKSDRSDTTNLTVGAGTEIMVKGAVGKLADVQAGMKAEFTAAGDNCSRLAVSEYTPPPEKPKGGRGGKKKHK